MSSNRIYLIHHSAVHADGVAVQTHLVEAPNKAQAILHIVREHMSARVATQNDLVIWLQRGLKVQTVSSQPAEIAPANERDARG